MSVCKNRENRVNHFRSKYCNQCGGKVYAIHGKSISHFFEDALHFVLHFEAKFSPTLKAIFFKPGKRSLEYFRAGIICYAAVGILPARIPVVLRWQTLVSNHQGSINYICSLLYCAGNL